MANTTQRDGASTASQIIDVAERLVQVRGFNDFSYADVASELGLTKASLHYHFAGKAELGAAMIERYSARFADALAEIEERDDDPSAMLDAYVRIYTEVLRDGRMCLCGMLAADFETLSEPMQKAVLGFFAENELWLERVLERGRREGTLQLKGTPAEVARAIVSTLEGAMLLARPRHDVDRFAAIADQVVASLAAPRVAGT